MKKVILAVLAFLIIFIPMCEAVDMETETNQKIIAQKIVRFHVIANSDSVQDQALKLKVRDAVIKYMYPKMNACKDIEESKKVLVENNDNIKNEAAKVIRQNGYNYSVSCNLQWDDFPIKTYGNITLPSGRYQAYKIIIGNGKGHNWWCVMFPPLCFIDITKGELSKTETEKNMKKVLNDREYKDIDNSGKNDIEVKFKIAEIFNKVFK